MARNAAQKVSWHFLSEVNACHDVSYIYIFFLLLAQRLTTVDFAKTKK